MKKKTGLAPYRNTDGDLPECVIKVNIMYDKAFKEADELRIEMKDYFNWLQENNIVEEYGVCELT